MSKSGLKGPREETDDIWSFSVTGQQWTKSHLAIPKSFPRVGLSSAVVDDVAYLFGGSADRFSALNLSSTS
jgi:hypothetical protein